MGTALAGAGYAAVGTTHSTADNDYHYGVAPQALVGLRLIFGDRASLDLTGREYFVSKVGADRDAVIARGEACASVAGIGTRRNSRRSEASRSRGGPWRSTASR